MGVYKGIFDEYTHVYLVDLRFFAEFERLKIDQGEEQLTGHN
jgi:hypothetical protein